MKDFIIRGYVIVNKETGHTLGGLYESIGGAKTSFNSIAQRAYKSHPAFGLVFQTQNLYEIKPLVIIEDVI